MLIIKNSEELKAHLNEHKDLIVPDEDVRIEYQVVKGELRNVECMDLYLMNDDERFDFNGIDFNGMDFNGMDFNGMNFNGRDFNGRDFNGEDFNGRNFNGMDFNGKKVSYWAFFNCCGSIECESIESRRTLHHPPVSLSGQIEITGTADTAAEEAIALLKEKGYKIVRE